MAQARGGMLEEGPGKADPDDDAVPAPRMADETLISVRPARRRRQPPGKDDRADGGEAGAGPRGRDETHIPGPQRQQPGWGENGGAGLRGIKTPPPNGTFAGPPLCT